MLSPWISPRHGARLAICARSETQLREVGEALRQQHRADVYEHAVLTSRTPEQSMRSPKRLMDASVQPIS